MKNKAKYIDLKPNQMNKLKLLTLADEAAKSPIVSYQTLMNSIGINDVRMLEDLLIDCLQLGLLKGKLDQRDRRLMVESTFGRDVSANEVQNMLKSLKDWDKQLEQAQHHIEGISKDHQTSLDKHNEITAKTEKKIQEQKDAILA